MKIEDSERQKGQKICLIGIAIIIIGFLFGPIGIFTLGIGGMVVATFGYFQWTTKEIDLSSGG